MSDSDDVVIGTAMTDSSDGVFNEFAIVVTVFAVITVIVSCIIIAICLLNITQCFKLCQNGQEFLSRRGVQRPSSAQRRDSDNQPEPDPPFLFVNARCIHVIDA